MLLLFISVSNVVLLQVVGEVINTIPTVSVMVFSVITHLTRGMVYTTCLVGMLNLFIAEMRYNFGTPPHIIVFIGILFLDLLLLHALNKTDRETERIV